MKINMILKKLIITFSILMIILITIFIILKNSHKPVREIIAYGNIEIREVDLAFKVNGRIENMFFEEGDYVKKGEKLAKLENQEYVAKYKKSKAQAEAAYALAKRAEDRYIMNKELCLDQTTSKLECSAILHDKNESYSVYKSLDAQKDVDKTYLEDTILYAPSNGVISNRIEEPGAIVDKNQSVFTLTLTEPLWARVYINEKYLANVKYGMKAFIYTDSKNNKGNNKVYEGKVGFISSVAEFTPKTVETTDLRTHLVYRIKVYITNNDGYLRQGMPITVKIPIQ